MKRLSVLLSLLLAACAQDALAPETPELRPSYAEYIDCAAQIVVEYPCSEEIEQFQQTNEGSIPGQGPILEQVVRYNALDPSATVVVDSYMLPWMPGMPAWANPCLQWSPYPSRFVYDRW